MNPQFPSWVFTRKEIYLKIFRPDKMGNIHSSDLTSFSSQSGKIIHSKPKSSIREVISSQRFFTFLRFLDIRVTYMPIEFARFQIVLIKVETKAISMD